MHVDSTVVTMKDAQNVPANINLSKSKSSFKGTKTLLRWHHRQLIPWLTQSKAHSSRCRRLLTQIWTCLVWVSPSCSDQPSRHSSLQSKKPGESRSLTSTVARPTTRVMSTEKHDLNKETKMMGRSRKDNYEMICCFITVTWNECLCIGLMPFVFWRYSFCKKNIEIWITM